MIYCARFVVVGFNVVVVGGDGGGVVGGGDAEVDVVGKSVDDLTDKINIRKHR